MKNKVLLAAVNSQYLHSCPALYALRRAAEAQGLGHMLCTKDFSINMPMLRVIEDILTEQPTVLAFSCYIWNMDYLRLLIEDLHQILPDVPCYLGGPEATMQAELLLRELPIAGVFLGEGEISFPAFLAALEKGEDLAQVPGLQRQGREKPLPLPRTDLAQTPFLYTPAELRELSQQHKIIYYESSRGCPFACSFCASAVEPLRERPLPLVFAELEQLAKAGGQIKFIDRTFNANERAVQITQKLLDLYRPGLSWHCEISPFHISPKLAELWKKTPKDYLDLEMGVQTLYPKALRAIGRRGDWDKAEPLVKELISQGNLHLHLDLIAGLPEDTPEEFAKSFHRLHQLNADYLQLGFLKVLPGSPLAATAREQGLIWENHPPYRILATPNMSAAWLLQLFRAERMFNALYNRGKDEFRQRLIEAAEKAPGGALTLYQQAAALHPGIQGLSQQEKITLVNTLCQ